MGVEIERKFLLKNGSWKKSIDSSVRMIQGYMAGGSGTPTVRVRLAGKMAWITIKGKASGISRSEYEYQIPAEDAEEMLSTLCGTRIVEKIRHYSGRWEIDEYLGKNAGLFTAEIELSDPDEKFEKPSFLGAEITGESMYSNGALSRRPYKSWEKK